jgi:hypothetical protein
MVLAADYPFLDVVSTMLVLLGADRHAKRKALA